MAIESSGAFRGRYHTLCGKLAPAHRIGPEKLRLAELQDRVVREGVTEVLLAVSTDMDGDATAGYIAELLRWHLASLPIPALPTPTHLRSNAQSAAESASDRC